MIFSWIYLWRVRELLQFSQMEKRKRLMFQVKKKQSYFPLCFSFVAPVTHFWSNDLWQEKKAIEARPCPDFILILSWFYSDVILILSRFYPDFIQILSRFYPDFLKTHFIQILSWFYPNFWKYLDKIRIKSG